MRSMTSSRRCWTVCLEVSAAWGLALSLSLHVVRMLTPSADGEADEPVLLQAFMERLILAENATPRGGNSAGSSSNGGAVVRSTERAGNGSQVVNPRGRGRSERPLFEVTSTLVNISDMPSYIASLPPGSGAAAAARATHAQMETRRQPQSLGPAHGAEQRTASFDPTPAEMHEAEKGKKAEGSVKQAQ